MAAFACRRPLRPQDLHELHGVQSDKDGRKGDGD